MTLFEQLAALATESVNLKTAQIDVATTRVIVGLLNEQDATVASAVMAELHYIAQAVDMIADRLALG